MRQHTRCKRWFWFGFTYMLKMPESASCVSSNNSDRHLLCESQFWTPDFMFQSIVFTSAVFVSQTSLKKTKNLHLDMDLISVGAFIRFYLNVQNKTIKRAATNNVAAINEQNTSQGTLIHWLSPIIFNSHFKWPNWVQLRKGGSSKWLFFDFNLNSKPIKRISAHYWSLFVFFCSIFSES